MAVATSLTLNSGQNIPIVGLGTYTRGNSQCKDAVLSAIQNGYRHIDTASYYNNEEDVGEAIQICLEKGIIKREDLFIVTKLYNDMHRADQVLCMIKTSLKKLKLDYVDLYLIHWPISTDDSGADAKIDITETWRAMEELPKLGLAKSIGVSNFNEAQIDKICAEGSIRPAVNQFEINPRLSCVNLVKHCQEKGIVVTAYCPLGTLPIVKKDRGKHPLHNDDPTLQNLSAKYGKTTAQIILRFLVQRGIVVIPKSSSETRIIQNIDIFDFQLTEEEIKKMFELNRDDRMITVEMWRDYLNYPF